MEMIYREKIASVYELKERGADVNWIIEHFTYKDDEVLYFVENEFLKAVVSIGDVFQYLEGKKKEILNSDFTQVLEKDADQAELFFSKHPTIHELPIVDSLGKLCGIMKSGKYNSKMLWVRFRLYLKALCFDVESYYQNSAEKFMKQFKGTV